MNPAMRFCRHVVFLCLAAVGVWAEPPAVEVVAEEEVYEFTSPDNGSGPLWSYGCSVIARSGENVVVSQMETGVDVPKLCNTRWHLLKRTDSGWTQLAQDDAYRQREPCPLAVLTGGRFFLNVNDSNQPAGTMYGPCEPKLLRFTLDEPIVLAPLLPKWDGTPYYTDHSYRGYAADPEADRLLMFNIDAKTSVEHWCLMTGDGETLCGGSVEFPIRSCYPQAGLKRGTAHILAVGDIVEPVQEWREYKFAQTQQKWDYVFRILYYASSPDIAKEDFGKPIEIANVDATAGYIGNQDLWIAPDGAAYILYTQREVQSPLLRDKFFPGKSLLDSLYLVVVRNGAIEEKRVLIEGSDTRQPGCSRFHAAPDGKVYVVMNLGGADTGNKVFQVYPPTESVEMAAIPFKKPFGSFCLASERAGTAPSNTIDIFGNQDNGNKMCYGQVRLR